VATASGTRPGGVGQGLAHARLLEVGQAGAIGLVDPPRRYREERRVAETILLRDDSLPLPPAPEQAQLEEYYKANTARFMAPEFRALTVLVIKPTAIAGQVEITPDMIEEAYQARLGEFQPADRVLLSQVVLADKAAADKAAPLVKAGKDLAAIAREQGCCRVDVNVLDWNEKARAFYAALGFGHNEGWLGYRLGL